MYNELKYIAVEEENLQNPIDFSNFDEELFENTLECKFNHSYNDRCFILNEIVDKEKLLYIIDNNDFDIEVNNLAKNYHDSLDDFGRKRVCYKQKSNHKDRYYGVGSCLTYLKRKLEILLCLKI